MNNLTIERFINILIGDDAADFSKIIDIILSGYILFVKFIMKKKFKF